MCEQKTNDRLHICTRKKNTLSANENCAETLIRMLCKGSENTESLALVLGVSGFLALPSLLLIPSPPSCLLNPSIQPSVSPQPDEKKKSGNLPLIPSPSDIQATPPHPPPQKKTKLFHQTDRRTGCYVIGAATHLKIFIILL